VEAVAVGARKKNMQKVLAVQKVKVVAAAVANQFF